VVKKHYPIGLGVLSGGNDRQSAANRREPFSLKDAWERRRVSTAAVGCGGEDVTSLRAVRWRGGWSWRHGGDCWHWRRRPVTSWRRPLPAQPVFMCRRCRDLVC